MPEPLEATTHPGLVLKFIKLSPRAITPTRGSALSAGLDLYAAQSLVIPSYGREVIATDLSIQVPDGTYGRISARSSLAAYHGLAIGAGVIDSDFRGPVRIVMFNHSPISFHVNQGDRIAQLVCERIVHPVPLEVGFLSETPRGSGGFGSTGQR